MIDRDAQVTAGIVIIVVLLLVVLADYPIIGQLGIGAYALIAFWRLGSKQVIRLAMVALGVMLTGIVMSQYQVTSTFADYAFLLLMVAVFVLGRELWRYSQELRRERKEDKA